MMGNPESGTGSESIKVARDPTDTKKRAPNVFCARGPFKDRRREGCRIEGSLTLVEKGFDALGEGIPRPVKAALHRPEVHPRDLGDLFITLSFEFP